MGRRCHRRRGSGRTAPPVRLPHPSCTSAGRFEPPRRPCHAERAIRRAPAGCRPDRTAAPSAGDRRGGPPRVWVPEDAVAQRKTPSVRAARENPMPRAGTPTGMPAARRSCGRRTHADRQVPIRSCSPTSSTSWRSVANRSRLRISTGTTSTRRAECLVPAAEHRPATAGVMEAEQPHRFTRLKRLRRGARAPRRALSLCTGSARPNGSW